MIKVRGKRRIAVSLEILETWSNWKGNKQTFPSSTLWSQRYPARWSPRDLRTGTDSTLPSSCLRSLWLSGPEQGRGLRKSSCNLWRSLGVTICELWKWILLSSERRAATQWVLCKTCMSKSTAKVLKEQQVPEPSLTRGAAQRCQTLCKVSSVFGGRHREFLFVECVCGSPWSPVSKNILPSIYSNLKFLLVDWLFLQICLVLWFDALKRRSSYFLTTPRN